MPVRVRRVYEDPSDEDGHRVLVDRLWPRGIRKADLVLDAWDKDLAPSTQLRRAFHDGTLDAAEFARRYREELAGNPGLEDLVARARTGTVTLLYAARDTEHNNARVLAEVVTALL